MSHREGDARSGGWYLEERFSPRRGREYEGLGSQQRAVNCWLPHQALPLWQLPYHLLFWRTWRDGERYSRQTPSGLNSPSEGASKSGAKGRPSWGQKDVQVRGRRTPGGYTHWQNTVSSPRGWPRLPENFCRVEVGTHSWGKMRG